MATWNSRGLRGSSFEEMINHTNEVYLERGLALIQKIPTPITPVKFDTESRHITLAYFDQQSTVDYIGSVQGVPVCFDAKECAKGTFPLQNVHPHQVAFMQHMEEQGGIAFLLILYTDIEACYYMPLQELLTFYERAENGGRKSFTREELTEDYFLRDIRFPFIPYLEMLARDLESRDEV